MNDNKLHSSHLPWFCNSKSVAYSRDGMVNRIPWWRHQMEQFSALLAICAANATGEFPTQRPVTRNFDVFFDLHLNKWLCKQSLGWWFETPSRPSWRHCNAIMAQRFTGSRWINFPRWIVFSYRFIYQGPLSTGISLAEAHFTNID